MSLLRPLARIWLGLLAVAALVLVLALAARALLPLASWAPAPALAASAPPAGAEAVFPRSVISLGFTVPMNRASVEAALRIEPPTPGRLVWSDDATTLTFLPALALTPAMTYSVSLVEGALDRWWRPLAAPVELRFATAAQPAVIAALPNGPGAPVDTALALVFSQPMVAADLVGRPANLPELRVTPPLAAQGRWLDQQTLLLMPGAPLAPATRYELSLDAGLRDLRGVELGVPLRWSFSTAWPEILERSPPDQARWVSPREPLRLRLAAPLELELLRQSLRLSPPVAGELSAELDGTEQLVSFTPRDGWAYGASYRVELVAPPGGELVPPTLDPWRFNVEPAPRLVAFFPGQGQILAPDEPIRLVFSTPMDEAGLRAGLQIEPPVASLPLSVNETEVRLLPDLQPSTLYTITLAAETRDRAGEPLGSAASVRLRTAPARPALSVPAAFTGLLNLSPAAPATVAFETINLSTIELSLYPLDQATLLRMLDLRLDEWANFSPERYGQALARSWRVAPGTTLDAPQRLDLPVGLNDGDPLASGAYYLRATSPEGPRSDLVLLVSAARLALRQGESHALLWATDTAGAPLAGLPVSLYQSGALLGQGQTDADGIWLLPLERTTSLAPLLALAQGDGPALARSDWLLTTPPVVLPQLRALLLADQLYYAPGERVQVYGLARRRDSTGDLVLPAVDTPCRLQLRTLSGTGLGPSVVCRIDGDGLLSGALPLAARLTPGGYSLFAQVGDAALSLPLSVVAPTPAAELGLSVTPVGVSELALLLTRDELPLPGSVISWSLQLEPMAAPPPPEGFALSTPPLDEPLSLEGVGTSDTAGRLTITLPATALSAVTYRLQATLATGSLSAEGLLSPGVAQVAVALPSRLVASDQRSTLTLLARDGLGRPLPGAAMTMEVYRAGVAGPPLISRRATAGADGRAAVELVQLSPGAYELVATAGGLTTRVGLWVYGGGFSAWPAEDGALTVIADRDRYAPGEVATLLVAAPALSGSLLLSVERAGLPDVEVRTVSASQLIRLPISADMAPGIVVSALLADGGQYRAGAATLAVDVPTAPLDVTLATGASDLLPGASTPLTVTTSLGGAAQPAAVLVALAPAAAPDGALRTEFQPGPPPPSQAAALPLPGAAPAPPPAAAPLRVQPPGTFVSLDPSTGAPGISVASVSLPNAPGRWRVSAYALAEQLAIADTTLSTSQPLSYRLSAPSSLGRDDRALLSLHLRNTSPFTREVSVRVASTGLSLSPSAPAVRRLSLAPGASEQLRWTARPAPGAETAQLRLTITSAELREQLIHDLSLSASPSAGLSGATRVSVGPLSMPLAPGGDPAAPLTLALAPGPHAALADQALALAALPAPSIEAQAALTIIAAQLADGLSGGAERMAWEDRARRGLAALDAAQGEDGGWGWWPDAPAQPFVTALALEAQLTARSVLNDPRPASLRAIAYLGRVSPAADRDTQAYIAYVRARAGHADPGAAGLAEGDLEADGLAFLALSLPPAQAGPLLERLLAQPTLRLAAVVGSSPEAEAQQIAAFPADMPRTPTTLTAVAAQALRASLPGAPQLPGAERALLSAWGTAGWPTPYEAARVALALPLRTPAPSGGPLKLRLGDVLLLDRAEALTTTLRLSLPADTLPENPELVVEARGDAPFMLAYSRPAAPAPAPARLALDYDLIDPTTGVVLDPASLRLGQIVGLRLSLVVAQPTPRVELSLALPAGLELLPHALAAPFQLLGPPHAGLLHLGAAPLASGIYRQSILVRATAVGSFSAAPALLRDPYRTAPAVASPQGLRIVISE